MWGGSSRVVALFPVKWDLTGVVSSVEEVRLHVVHGVTLLDLLTYWYYTVPQKPFLCHETFLSE